MQKDRKDWTCTEDIDRQIDEKRKKNKLNHHSNGRTAHRSQKLPSHIRGGARRVRLQARCR